jgi:fibronectin type 3 domain-containing protein
VAVPHSVSLSWMENSGTVQGYYVYRGGQSGGPYSRVSSLLSLSSYSDASVTSGSTYYYVVTAVGTNSQESGYSNEVQAVIP